MLEPEHPPGSAAGAGQEVVDVARRNLELLRPEGLNARLNVTAHRENVKAAAQAVTALLRDPPPDARAFVADATDAISCARELGELKPDIVLLDTPYGEQTAWADPHAGVVSLLNALVVTTQRGTAVGLVTANRFRLPDTAWERAGTWNVGKRRLWLLKKE